MAEAATYDESKKSLDKTEKRDSPPSLIEQLFLDRIAGIVRTNGEGRPLTLGQQIWTVCRQTLRSTGESGSLSSALFGLRSKTGTYNGKKKKKKECRVKCVKPSTDCCKFVATTSLGAGDLVKLDLPIRKKCHPCRCSPRYVKKTCRRHSLPTALRSWEKATVRCVRPFLSYEWALSSFALEQAANVTPTGVAADCCGNVYVCGFFTGRVRISTAVINSTVITPFIAKIGCDGKWVFVQVPTMGTDAAGDARAIAVDRCGNVYITGDFQGTMQWGDSPVLTAASGGLDTWVVKMKPNGVFVLATQTFGVGAAGSTEPSGIAVDARQNVYLVGIVGGALTPRSAQFGPFIVTSVGIFDVWIAKLSAAFAWQWVNSTRGTLGQTLLFASAGIELDGRGSLFIAGSLSGIFAPPYTAAFGSIVISALGSQDVFIAKASTCTGSWEAVAQIMSSPVPTTTSVDVFDLAVDCRTGAVYITGSLTASGGGVVQFGPQAFTIANPNTAFETYVSKLANDLTWIYTRVVEDPSGQPNFNVGTGVVVDASGNVYVTGSYRGEPIFSRCLGLISPTSDSVYLAKLTPDGEWVKLTSSVDVTPALSFADTVTTRSIAASPQGNVYVIGVFNGAVRFGCLEIFSPHVPTDDAADMFVVKVHDDLASGAFGVTKRAVRKGKMASIRLFGKSRPQSFCDLVPSFEYYRNEFTGKLVVGCSAEICADPNLAYLGVACSTNRILKPVRPPSTLRCKEARPI